MAGLLHTLRRSSVNLMHIGACFRVKGAQLGMLRRGRQMKLRRHAKIELALDS